MEKEINIYNNKYNTEREIYYKQKNFIKKRLWLLSILLITGFYLWIRINGFHFSYKLNKISFLSEDFLKTYQKELSIDFDDFLDDNNDIFEYNNNDNNDKNNLDNSYCIMGNFEEKIQNDKLISFSSLAKLSGVSTEEEKNEENSYSNGVKKCLKKDKKNLNNLKLPYDIHHDVISKGKFGAVSCDVPECSKLGVEVLRDKNGTAIDAMVSVALCIGVINMFSSGIGGGGFMLVYDSNSKSAETFNFREMAPAASTKDMYDNDSMLSRIGGLAVGIPGELAGLYAAHKKYGVIPWKDLVLPVAEIAQNGFIASEPLELAVDVYKSLLFNSSDDRFYNHWNFLLNNKTNNPVKQGDRVYRKELAKTLKTIAHTGIYEFYNGSIAQSLVKEIRRTGGIATLEDFSKYFVETSTAINTTFQLNSNLIKNTQLDKKIIYTVGAPASGSALIFGINLAEALIKELQVNEEVSSHLIVEMMKWISSGRTELGDPDFLINKDKVALMQTKEFAHQIVKNISLAKTYGYKHYNPSYEPNEPHGTAHVSIIDVNGLTVSLTTTVNLGFGCLVHDNVTGIVLNSEMDDFSTPRTKNAFLLHPSIYNYIEPYKRPLSSTVPTIVVENGIPIISIGASGGSHIVTTVLQGLVRILVQNVPLAGAIQWPRFHHQLLPEIAFYEAGTLANLVDALESRGHNTSLMPFFSVMNGVHFDPSSGIVTGVSDFYRKRGLAAAY